MKNPRQTIEAIKQMANIAVAALNLAEAFGGKPCAEHLLIRSMNKRILHIVNSCDDGDEESMILAIEAVKKTMENDLRQMGIEKDGGLVSGGLMMKRNPGDERESILPDEPMRLSKRFALNDSPIKFFQN